MPQLTIASVVPNQGLTGTRIKIWIRPLETLAWSEVSTANAFIENIELDEIEVAEQNYVIAAKIPTNNRDLEVPGPKNVMVRLEDVIGTEYESNDATFTITSEDTGGRPTIRSVTPSRAAKDFKGNLTLTGDNLRNVIEVKLILVGAQTITTIIEQEDHRMVIKPRKSLEVGEYSFRLRARDHSVIQVPSVRFKIIDFDGNSN